MKRIVELSDNIKSMIAAGEVIEGPYSVVKELLENSLDAGADEIKIDVTESGMKKIFISDNGEGIAKDDLKLAVTEHATSKINRIEDISNILSYGFRGEALSSIASVSKMTILSRSDEEDIGGKLVVQNGKFEETDYAGARGTVIVVENLFYNIPARKKFLHSLAHESKLIREIILKIAASSYNVFFSITINEKKPLILKKCSSLKERLCDIYGNEFISQMHYDKIRDMHVEIEGFISKSEYLKSNRRYQSLYVNNRPINYKNMSFHLSRAYDSILSTGKYPAAILFVNIKPDLVDVNVHPSKKEIKFFDSKYFDTLIYGFAKKILDKSQNNVEISKTIEEREHREESQIRNEAKPVELFKSSNKNLSSVILENINENNVEKLHEQKDIYPADIENDEYKIFGIVFGTYIIVENKNELKIIDLHAAHERIVYDELILKKVNLDTQELMFPENVEFPLNEYNTIFENIEILNNMGFSIDVFSDNSFAISGIPAILKKINIKNFLLDFCEQLEKGIDFERNINEIVIERIACHSAKRANDHLSNSEIELLTEKVFSGKYDLRCPHGRPFVRTITQLEFEKIFKR